MVDIRAFPATALVQAVAAINIIGNVFAIILTFIYFGVLEPRLSGGSATDVIGERLAVVAAVTVCVILLIGPINARWVIGLVREVRRKSSLIKGDAGLGNVEELRPLVGRLLTLPVKLGVTTMAGWAIGAILFSAIPHLWPEIYPWPHESSHKISAWMVLVAAPITMCWIYFPQERWLRINLCKMFPSDVLAAVPSSFRINVLPKILIVSLLITTIPLALVSHVTLHQVTEIQAGRQSIDNFLNHIPSLIRYLTILFAFVAISLSFFLAKSVSEPLKDLESVMERVGSGDVYASVPVVSNDEIGRAQEGFNEMVTERRELDSIKDTFGRYLSTDVVDEILKSPGGMDLRGELRDLSILVADLRGFTHMTESLEPRKVLAIVNQYLESMTEIIIKHRGTIDEFTGDGILVFFGAPKLMEDHCRRAVACALEMQQAMDAVNASNRARDLPEVRAGIGINSGELIVGNIGSEKRKKYGAVGSPINLAFRIQSQALGGETLVSPEIVKRLDQHLVVRSKGEVTLKGLEKPITLFYVESLRSSP